MATRVRFPLGTPAFSMSYRFPPENVSNICPLYGDGRGRTGGEEKAPLERGEFYALQGCAAGRARGESIPSLARPVGQATRADHPTDKPDSTSPSVAFWPLRATRCAECPQKEARLGGWVAERSKAPVLKTGGHRPYLSPLDGYSVVLSGFTGCSLPSCPACSCPVPVCWAANPVAKGGSSPSSS